MTRTGETGKHEKFQWEKFFESAHVEDREEDGMITLS
jgi:hypothetical protein